VVCEQLVGRVLGVVQLGRLSLGRLHRSLSLLILKIIINVILSLKPIIEQNLSQRCSDELS
jgi:hypothetical protein